MEVYNMRQTNGNTAKNQFEIQRKDGILFQSYNSAIALKTVKGKIHLSEHWDYSSTTGKFRNMFLGENKAETEKKIKSGEYVIDLSTDGGLIKG